MASLPIDGQNYDLGTLTVADHQELASYARGKGVTPAGLLQELETMHLTHQSETDYLADPRFVELLDVVLRLVWIGARAGALTVAQRVEAATGKEGGATWVVPESTIQHAYTPAQVVAGLRLPAIRTWLRSALGAALPDPS